VPQEIWNRCFRARGAHINAFEGFPLFAAAMVCSLLFQSYNVSVHRSSYDLQIAGNVAQIPTQDMNALAVQYLGVRALYSMVYIGGRSEALSYLRTGLWAWSIGIPIWGIGQGWQGFERPRCVAHGYLQIRSAIAANHKCSHSWPLTRPVNHMSPEP